MGMMTRRNRKRRAQLRKAAQEMGQATADSANESADALESLTVAELREKAKEQGLEGYSRLSKGELLDLLKGGRQR